MTYSQACAALKARLVAQWSHADILLFWPNEQPEDADGKTGRPFDAVSKDPLAFLRIDFNMGAPRRVMYGGGIGDNTYRQSGDMVVQILVPSNTGVDTVNGYVDDVVSALIGYRSGDLRIETCAAAGTGGDEEDGDYFRRDVLANFFFDLQA